MTVMSMPTLTSDMSMPDLMSILAVSSAVLSILRITSMRRLKPCLKPSKKTAKPPSVAAAPTVTESELKSMAALWMPSVSKAGMMNSPSGAICASRRAVGMSKSSRWFGTSSRSRRLRYWSEASAYAGALSSLSSSWL